MIEAVGKKASYDMSLYVYVDCMYDVLLYVCVDCMYAVYACILACMFMHTCLCTFYVYVSMYEYTE